MHDLKGLLLALCRARLDVAGVTSDTALAAYLALPGQRTFDLADLVLRYLHLELRAGTEPSRRASSPSTAARTRPTPRSPRSSRCAPARSLDLARALDDELDRRGARPVLLRDVELPLLGVLADMERTGIAVDLDYLVDLQAQFAGEVKAADAGGVRGGRPRVQPRLAQAAAGDPVRRAGAAEDQADQDRLHDRRRRAGRLSRADPDPLLERLLRHRDVSRLKTVVDSLIPMVDDDGRIHTTFNQVVAATGRLSSQDPNLQNIPIRTAEGRRIRRAFVVGTGFESLLTADYSQIEMRIMATLSEDAGLIEAFQSGEDLHTIVASRVFDVPPESVDPELRRRIKAMSYGLAYGLSAYGLAQQLGIPPTRRAS